MTGLTQQLIRMRDKPRSHEKEDCTKLTGARSALRGRSQEATRPRKATLPRGRQVRWFRENSCRSVNERACVAALKIQFATLNIT